MKRFLSLFLSILMLISLVPIDNFTAFAAEEDQINITSILPNKVSATNGKIVTIKGSGFGNSISGISVRVFAENGGPQTILSDNILSVNNTEIVVMVPNNSGTASSAQLIVDAGANGSASTAFEYVEDPTITKIMTNTEITVYRDSDGEIIKNPDGTVKRDKQTYVEIYGTFNLSENDEIEQNVKFVGDTPVNGTVVEQKSGYVKVSLPDHFVFNKTYDITINNKYGGTTSQNNVTINLASHDTTQLSSLMVSIGDKLGILGTNFPPEANLEVRLVNTSGEDTASIYGSTTPSSNLIEIEVPQVATAGYQKVKVINTSNNTAVTFVDNLLVLPKPGEFNVTAISPNAGTKAGGTEVRVIGTGLNPDMKVKFGNEYATNVELDTEMSVGDTTVLKVITPSATNAGPVDITVENTMDNGVKVFSGLFRYTEVDNSLVFIDLNPTQGFETGGTTVTLTGINFQRTTKDVDNKTIKDEDAFTVINDEGEVNRVLVLEKQDIPDFQVPGTDEIITVDRTRELRVYFGGRKAEIVTIDEGGTPLATIINPDTGQQEMIVRTPQIALDPRKDTPVDVEIEIVTKYYRDGTTDLVDQYTEKATSSRQFTYKPVPSAPELLAVDNEELEAAPTVPSDPDAVVTMAKGPAGDTVYIYGLDFRPDADVYFFKETNEPINEYLVSSNKGQVVSVDSLGYSLNNKLVYRIEVLTPNIQELGEVTVLVHNGDEGRTKTLNEFISESERTENELIIRQFEYLSTPVIDEITPEFGSTTTGERPSHQPVAMIIGNMFLVDNEEYGDGNTQILYPTVYAVPRSTLTQDIVDKLETDQYDKYKAEILEVTTEKNDKLIALDGVKNRIGTKISVKLPIVDPSEKGYRDIVVINPDGGIARLIDAFEYKQPKKQPEILSIAPDKGTIDGGQQVTIEGKDFDYDINETLITVTIGGEIVEPDSIERSSKGDNVLLINITTPPGTEGEKILQVINNDDGGTGEGKYTYTRVFTNPKIDSITPDHGGPYTQVIIKGDDFVLPDPSATDIYEQIGTRVFFNEDELNDYTVLSDPDDASSSVVSSVYVSDKNTIILTLPENLPLGLKDVKIINPDTTNITEENAFTYLDPNSEPEIYEISPNEGTRDGGTKVVITGEDFREGVEVYFGERKGTVEKILEEDGQAQKLFVTTPSYPVDEKITDSITVSITVVNTDGGSDTIKDGFTFRVPGSFPKLTTIDPNEGTTAGYETVVLSGDDFRFDDINENGVPDEGETLPKVYFGWEEAVEVQFSSYGVLMVKTPPQETEGKVDVTIINPDAGAVVLKDGFTYKMSKPTITSVTPDTVTKFGGTEVTIIGTGFIDGRTTGDQTDQLPVDPDDSTTPIYGVDIDVEVILGDEEVSSRIIGGYAEVTLGDLVVNYDNRDASNPNMVTVKYKDEADKTFKLKPRQSRIIILQTGDETKNSEGVKIAVKNDNLIVTRRLATAVKYVDSNTLIVTTPSMDDIGTKDVRVVNRDNGTANGIIIIKNPDSKPVITDIDPKREVLKSDGSGEIDYYAVESVIDGGITFTIEGTDFRKGVRVMIGSQEAEIISRNNDDTKIVVRSPEGRESDINKPLRIVVINEDGESADSALSKIGEAQVPAYYIYRSKESDPRIDSVTPDSGSAAGGEEITITGNDFRIENITVRIGASEATVDLTRSSYKELVVITPPSEILGPVDIFIRNESALGEVILEDGFTYYSNPSIDSVTPDIVHNDGGHKVTLSGTMFMEGAKVYIDGVEAQEVTVLNDTTIEILTPAGEVGVHDIVIENADSGTGTLVNGITYVLPVPDDPSGFTATPGHERSIVLNWNETTGAYRYKIFGRLSSKDDYAFIGETTETEYYLKDLKEDTKYYFRLWAINEYGESLGYDYASTRTLKAKKDDADDKYDIEETKDTIVSYSNGAVKIDLPTEYSGSEYTVDLRDNNYDSYDTIQINIPLSSIKEGKGGVYVQAKDILMYVPMYDLAISTYFYRVKESDSNVIITLSKLDKSQKSRLTKGLSRNEAAGSQAYSIDLTLQEGKNTEALKINSGINFTIIMDKDTAGESDIYMTKHSSEDNKLKEYDYAIDEVYDYERSEYVYYVTSQVLENGKFIVIYKK